MCNGICYLDRCCCALAKKDVILSSCIWNALRSEAWNFNWEIPTSCNVRCQIQSRLQSGRCPVDDITVILLLFYTDFNSAWRTTAPLCWNRAGLQFILPRSTNPHLPFQDVFPCPCPVYVTITTATFVLEADDGVRPDWQNWLTANPLISVWVIFWDCCILLIV